MVSPLYDTHTHARTHTHMRARSSAFHVRSVSWEMADGHVLCVCVCVCVCVQRVPRKKRSHQSLPLPLPLHPHPYANPHLPYALSLVLVRPQQLRALQASETAISGRVISTKGIGGHTTDLGRVAGGRKVMGRHGMGQGEALRPQEAGVGAARLVGVDGATGEMGRGRVQEAEVDGAGGRLWGDEGREIGQAGEMARLVVARLLGLGVADGVDEAGEGADEQGFAGHAQGARIHIGAGCTAATMRYLARFFVLSGCADLYLQLCPCNL